MDTAHDPDVNRYLLLDRDGTLIVERDYLADPDLVELTPGAAEALASLRRGGWGAIVISNQSGVARGLVTNEQVDAVNARMIAALERSGASIDGVYVCPHGPDDRCGCRKPAIGLVTRAVADLGFDPAECIVVGDKPSDLALGRALNAATVLVRTGYGRETERTNPEPFDLVIDDLRGLPEAVVALETHGTRLPS